MQRGLRGLVDEVLQPVDGGGEAAKEEGVHGAIAAGELPRVQVPALVEAVGERVADVVCVQSPRGVDGARVLALLLLAKRVSFVRSDGHGGGCAV